MKWQRSGTCTVLMMKDEALEIVNTNVGERTMEQIERLKNAMLAEEDTLGAAYQKQTGFSCFRCCCSVWV
ncbi:MAG: hypothetical protein IPM82_31120 [Saprospiraceae bacterium]|nr:hypothetical protein [Saprospiraceae bacterium]